MKKLLSVTLLCLSTALFSWGQDGMPLSTKNKKAAKHFQVGKEYFDERKDDQAEDALQAAINEDSDFIEAHVLLGFVYKEENKDDAAIIEFKKAININPQFMPELFFTVGAMELYKGKYDDALPYLEQSLAFKSNIPQEEFQKKVSIDDCHFAMDALKHPVPFNPVNMGPSINSEYNEYFPAITADGSTFLFTRDIPDNNNIEGHQEDFYISFKVNGQWTKAANVGPPLNTYDNEGAPTISADGNLLIYAACNRPDGYGSCDLYYSFKVGNSWTPGRNLGPTVNSHNWESQPSLSSDGRTLYFIRGMFSGDGIKNPDIYVTVLGDSGKWSKPERLSDTINTPGQEESVLIADDNQTLYFSSDGHPGMGGLDIFISRRLPNGRWGIPKNLGYPINTYEDENSILVDPSGKIAYFSSNRQGGYGGLDFYSYELYDSIRPNPITYVKGKVYDANTHKPLMATFTLTDLATGEVAVHSFSAQYDGTFLVCLPLDKNYALDVSRKGYLFYSENFSLKGILADAAHPYMMNVPLQPIDTGAKIVLKNIFFETDKYNLKPESHIELQKVISFLNANPTVKIEISGHTDNTGTVQHNIVLSENRAKSVYNYLIQHGVPADRLTYKGYGQSRPIADNSTPEGRAQNRRTEMKIISK